MLFSLDSLGLYNRSCPLVNILHVSVLSCCMEQLNMCCFLDACGWKRLEIVQSSTLTVVRPEVSLSSRFKAIWSASRSSETWHTHTLNFTLLSRQQEMGVLLRVSLGCFGLQVTEAWLTLAKRVKTLTISQNWCLEVEQSAGPEQLSMAFRIQVLFMTPQSS